MKFAADGLPEGLMLDPETGIVTGTTPATGEYKVTFRATNARGAAARSFTLVAGDRLALTPPMGYNHWYTNFNWITQDLMLQAAEALVSSGMADAGYQYVNVDDCWMNAPSVSKYQTDPKRVGACRDSNGNLVPNVWFPDMKGLANAIHAKGLKAGIYTSPGPRPARGSPARTSTRNRMPASSRHGALIFSNTTGAPTGASPGRSRTWPR